jgi:hypothetical protein
MAGFKNCRRSIRLVGLSQLREKGRQEPESASAREREGHGAQKVPCVDAGQHTGGRFTRNVRFRIFAIDQVVLESETSSTTSRHVEFLLSL